MNIKAISVLLGIFLGFALPANAEKVKELESSIEMIHAFYLGKDLHGYIKTKACETCKEVMIKISPRDRAYLDNKPVPLKRFVMSADKPDVVHIDKKTKRLRIMWFSN